MNRALPPLPVYVSSSGHTHNFLSQSSTFIFGTGTAKHARTDVITEGRVSPAMSPIATDFVGRFSHIRTLIKTGQPDSRSFAPRRSRHKLIPIFCRLKYSGSACKW